MNSQEQAALEGVVNCLAPDAIDEDFVPSRSPSVAAVELDGEAVLYDEATAALHVLNPSAALLWFCFDGAGTLGEIASDITETTGVDRDIVARDVIEMARRLGREGLLEGVLGERPLRPDGGDEPTMDATSNAPRTLADPPSR